MAATIDDLIIKIDVLLSEMERKNRHNNNNGNYRMPVGGNGEETYANLTQTMKNMGDHIIAVSKRFESLEKALGKIDGRTKFGRKEDKGDTTVHNALEEFQKKIKEANAALASMGSTVTMNDSKEFLDSYFASLAEGTKLTEENNAHQYNLLTLEQEIYNNKIKSQNAELEARQKYSDEILAQSETMAKLNENLANFDQEIELINNSVKEFRRKLQEQNQDKYKQIAQTDADKKNVDAEAKLKGDLERSKGYKNGKKKGSSELHDKIAEKKEKWHKATTGRKVGMIAAKGANMAAGAAKAIQSGKMDVSGMADKASQALSMAGPWGAAAGGLIQIFKVMFEMYSKVDKAASDYARSVGGGAHVHRKMASEAAKTADAFKDLKGKIYEADEVLKRMSETSAKIGSNLEYISTLGKRELLSFKEMGIDDEAISNFHTLGVSVENASRDVAKLMGDAASQGLNAKAVTKAFVSNLKMANNLTFARGRKALADMALKAAQLKFNLKDAEQFANKVSTLEGAMTAGAQLSVLGGNFAMQGNPLAMMYHGLNDVEGLQEQMLAMTKGMARWDSKKGQLDISAFDRERLKAMGQATGIDYSDLTSQALNQARVDRVAQQLGGGVSKQLSDYVKNLAYIDENGTAKITYHGANNEEITTDVSKLKDNPELLKYLEAESELKKTKENATIGDIVGETRGIQDKLDDLVKTIKNKIVNLLMKIAGLKDHEKYAMEHGIDLEDKDAMKKLKRAKNAEKFATLGKEYFDPKDIWKFLTVPTLLYHQFDSVSKAINHNASGAMDEVAKAAGMGVYSQGKSHGGKIIGAGGPHEDKVPMLGSNGEYVMTAEATEQFEPVLKAMNDGRYERHSLGGKIGQAIKNGANMMKYTPIGLPFAVMEKLGKTSSGGGNTNHSIKIEFGTLELKIGDLSRVLDSNEVASRLLNNSAFVDNIVKEIGIRANFGYRKDDSSNKFLDSPFVRSF